MLSDHPHKVRKIEVKINTIYDILPPPSPRALLIQNACHMQVDGRVLVEGGVCAFRELWKLQCKRCKNSLVQNLIWPWIK